MTATCAGCHQPLDLTQPHVKIVRQVEREQTGAVYVDDSVVVSQWHLEHAPAEQDEEPLRG